MKNYPLFFAGALAALLLSGCVTAEKKASTGNEEVVQSVEKEPEANSLNAYLTRMQDEYNKNKTLDRSWFDTTPVLDEMLKNSKNILGIDASKSSELFMYGTRKELAKRFSQNITLGKDQSCSLFDLDKGKESSIAKYECDLADGTFMYIDFKIASNGKDFKIIDLKTLSTVNWVSKNITDQYQPSDGKKFPEDNFKLIAFMRQLGRGIFSERLYQQLSDKHQHSPLVLINSLAVLGEYPEPPAITSTIVERYEATCNSGKSCWTTLYSFYADGEDSDLPIGYLEKIVAEEPKSFLARKRLAHWYLSTDRYQEALEQGRVMLQLRPDIETPVHYIFAAAAGLKKRKLAMKAARALVHSFQAKPEDLSNYYTKYLVDDQEFMKKVL